MVARAIKLGKYIVSGLLATAANLAILYVATEWLGIWYLLSSTIAFSTAVVISFLLQKYWTFQDASKEGVKSQFVFFVLVAVFGLVLNAALLYLFVEFANVYYILAQVINGVLIAALNFLFYRVVFSKKLAGRYIRFLSRHKEILTLTVVFLIFLVVRVQGLDLPYHQDEMKTALAIEQGGAAAAGLHHPPLTQLIFRLGGLLFAEGSYRFLPLLFGTGALVLLYVVVRRRLGAAAALVSSALFAISAYGVWSSLMLDTDGAILPFFFLLSVYFYDRWRENVSGMKGLFLGLLLTSLIIGFLVKLSFVLVVLAIASDFIWENRRRITRKYLLTGFSALVGFFGLSVLAMLLVKIIYPFFDIGAMIDHALSYVKFSGRNYSQILIQALKAVFYFSPLLLVPIVFVSKEIFSKMRIFFIYLGLGLIFYFILFDFSSGALDKYLMFMIIPLAAICGTILKKVFEEGEARLERKYFYITIFFSSAFAVLLIALNFLNHIVLPLYPKGEWFGKVANFDWNFLNPFTGGSGPIGFYVSFLFLGLSFLISVGLGLVGLFKKEWRRGIAVIMILVSVAYNGVMVEELLWGKINGSVPKIIRETTDFISQSNDLKSFLTYNDTGAYELSHIGKYGGRFYAAPQYEETHRQRFSEWVSSGVGYFLVVDMPLINENSFYGEFFGECERVFETNDKAVTGRVYACDNNKAR